MLLNHGFQKVQFTCLTQGARFKRWRSLKHSRDGSLAKLRIEMVFFLSKIECCQKVAIALVRQVAPVNEQIVLQRLNCGLHL